MNKRWVWLRIAYWLGIVADGLEAVMMIWPQIYVWFSKVDLVPDAEFAFGMRYGAPLMVGWTALLLWANHKPVARKDILLITAFFPVLGYYVFRLYSVMAGFNSWAHLLPTLGIQTILFVLLLVGYRQANLIEAACEVQERDQSI